MEIFGEVLPLAAFPLLLGLNGGRDSENIAVGMREEDVGLGLVLHAALPAD